MKRLFTILLCWIPMLVHSQTAVNFDFSSRTIAITTDYRRPGTGGTLWNDQDAPYGTMLIPSTANPQPPMDAYFRFSMTDFFGNASASDSTIIFTRLDAFFERCKTNKQGARFRVMGLCNNCGNPPNDNFNNQVNYGGGWQVIPQFLHNLQQSESDPAKRDIFITQGDQDAWIPNMTSGQYQRWVRKLSQAIANHINSTSNYKDILRIYDIGYYGCYSEQHSNCICLNNVSELPAAYRPELNDAAWIEIVDAQTDYFGGDPSRNWKIVVPFNSLDAHWLPHTYNSVTYGQYLIDHPDSLGLINDHLGAVEGYDADYWPNNNRLGSRGGTSRQAIINNRWRFSPHGGEPVEWGSPADRSGLVQYVQNLHLSWFGDGNLNGVLTNSNTTEANNFRLASRLAGYRLRPVGGSANAGASLVINLQLVNEGNAPVYENWNIQYLVKNTAGTSTLATLNSNYAIRYNLQPSTSSTTITQAFGMPAVPVGTYSLYVRIVDPTGFRNPMPLSITGQQSDGSYFLGTIQLGGGTNQVPIANAGPNQSIIGTSATLNGTSSSDPDGTITNYLWTQVGSTPNTATIVSPTSATTNITGLVAGTYTFNLLVTDNNGATANDQVQITVNPANQPPTVDAGVNQTTSSTNVNLTGSASDADGTITSYQWTQRSGPNTATIVTPTASSTIVSSLIIGTYVFRLTATDNGGLTAFDEVTITVTTGNTAPIANAGANQTIFQPASSVTLTGSGTDNGSIASYQWTQVGGPVAATITSPTSATTTVTGLTDVGAYIFRLTVFDDTGLPGNDDVQITVQPSTNMNPVAVAGADVLLTLPTNFTQLNGTASSDPEGGPLTYNWQKTAGPATYSCLLCPSNAIVNAESLQIGVYTFCLTVTDNQNLTNTDCVNITVQAAANNVPVSDAGVNQIIQLPTSSTSLDGTGSIDDNAITVYTWSIVSQPVGGAVNISNSSIASPSISNMLMPGDYVFNLRVQDAAGLFDDDQVTITVLAAANTAPIAIIAGGNQTIQLPTNITNLDGQSSTDPDGTIVSYLWSQLSGPPATIVTPTAYATSINDLVEGIYFFQLLVTDNGGLTDTDIIQITVRPVVIPRPALDGRSLLPGLKFLPRQQ